MKEFLSEYGGYIIAAVAIAILVVLVIFFKDPIKNSMTSTTTKLTQVAETQLEGVDLSSETGCLAANSFVDSDGKLYADSTHTYHYEWSNNACKVANGGYTAAAQAPAEGGN